MKRGLSFFFFRNTPLAASPPLKQQAPHDKPGTHGPACNLHPRTGTRRSIGTPRANLYGLSIEVEIEFLMLVQLHAANLPLKVLHFRGWLAMSAGFHTSP